MATFSLSDESQYFDEDLRPALDTERTTPIGGSAFQFIDDQDIEPSLLPLTLPSGCWTLLSAVEACDNATLPRGPFNSTMQHFISCKKGSCSSRVYKSQSEEGGSGDDEQDQEELVPLFVSQNDTQPIGFLRPQVTQALQQDNKDAVEKLKLRACWMMMMRPNQGQSGAGDKSQGASDDKQTSQEHGKSVWAVAFEDWVVEEGKEAMSEHMDRLCRNWKHQNLFSDQLGGWRDELYCVYGPKFSQDDARYTPLPGANVACDIERAAASLFGIATFGAHMNAYVRYPDNKYYIWIPRRSKTKQTWPGLLDNSVAGGITSGDTPLETVIRECAEEASLPPDFVRRNIRAGGIVSYIFRGVNKWLQPEIQYVYDLEMPKPPGHTSSSEEVTRLPQDGNPIQTGLLNNVEKATKTPQLNERGEPNILIPNDGEAEEFALMSATDVVQHIVNGEFKPNCALVLIDFFIRHGLLTAESDAKFLEICARLHRSIEPLSGPA